jgi:hypothetical protein
MSAGGAIPSVIDTPFERGARLERRFSVSMTVGIDDEPSDGTSRVRRGRASPGRRRQLVRPERLRLQLAHLRVGPRTSPGRAAATTGSR